MRRQRHASSYSELGPNKPCRELNKLFPCRPPRRLRPYHLPSRVRKGAKEHMRSLNFRRLPCQIVQAEDAMVVVLLPAWYFDIWPDS
eukprot:6488325-Amphidinium_carterae.1